MGRVLLMPAHRLPRSRAEEEAIKEYARSHWGERGNEAISQGEAADPRQVSTLLGYLHGLVYVAPKGSSEPVFWEHLFDSKRPPALCYERPSGKLLIIGGAYRVTASRGIVR